MSGSAFRVVVAPQAARDIAKIVAKSRKDFGQLAAERYEALMAQALIDIGEDPRRLGATVRPDLLPSETYVYHLSFSRDRTSGQKVKEPRHFIGYRIKPRVVEVSRVLHDRRDLARHLSKSGKE